MTNINPPTTGEQAPRKFANMLHYGAGALSLALVVSGAVWGVKLIMRDVSGVPVVRAQLDPARTVPEDPGGQVTDHLGLQVNHVAGSGSTAAPEETASLAFPDTGLSAEDMLDAPDADTLADQTQDLTRQILENVGSDLGADNTAPVTELPQNEVSVPDLTRDDRLASSRATNPTLTLEPGVPENVASSLRPKPRPQGLDTSSAVQSPTVGADSAVITDTVNAGSTERRGAIVQLGSLPSETNAQAEWAVFSASFPELSRRFQHYIEPAVVSGRTTYRLRLGGFDDLSAARRTCTMIKASGFRCLAIFVQ